MHGSVFQCFFFAEHLQRLVLWRRRKSVIAGILHHLAAFDDHIDLILKVIFVLIDIPG